MRTEITNEDSRESPREGRRDRKLVQRSEVYKRSEVTDETGLTKRDVYKRTDETDESGRTRTEISASSTTDGGPAAPPPAEAPAQPPPAEEPAAPSSADTPAAPPPIEAPQPQQQQEPLPNGPPADEIVPTEAKRPSEPSAGTSAPPSAEAFKALAAALDDEFGTQSADASLSNGPSQQEPLPNGQPAEEVVPTPAKASADPSAGAAESKADAFKALAAALDEATTPEPQ